MLSAYSWLMQYFNAQISLYIRVNAVPRFSGLNHFFTVSDVTFTDGTKYEDVSKVHITHVSFVVIVH